ncbi:MAG: branched-chain amino acid ABC transporter permease [Bacillota bacterium]|nr:branched-chain amino acid ABC transporter permease [Bacillota bacterium]
MEKKYLKRTGIFLIASVVLFAILFGLMKADIIGRYYTQIIILMGINVILALGLNLILGFTGQLALGHAGFMSVGAYTAAMLTIKLHLPFLVVIILGGVMAGLFGLLIGIPTLRLKGDYLAITTLGFAQIIQVAITNIEPLGGARGLAGIPPKTTFVWTFFIVVAVIAIIYNIVNSSQGRAMISISEDEIASEAMGINTTKYKMMAFVIGSAFAGVAGALYAHYYMFLDPASFNFMKSVDIVAYVVLGGMGSIAGSVISASALTGILEALRPLGDFRMVIYPILLILIMRFRPQGLLGKSLGAKSLFKNKRKGGKNVTAESK